jgi:tRNA (pseudouridine54-N1)-methyltransferase
VRRFVVIGQKAIASPEFSLDDIPGTSGRLDVLLRSLRAALLVSHGLRRDTIAYLVLLGGPRAPRTVRIDGAAIRFVRPDERCLASMVKKALERDTPGGAFVDVRAGLAVADAGLDAVLADAGVTTAYVLEEGAADVRDVAIDARAPLFFVGDHLGFDHATRTRIASMGAIPIAVSPLSLHADDAITLVSNELDRHEAARDPRAIVEGRHAASR